MKDFSPYEAPEPKHLVIVGISDRTEQLTRLMQAMQAPHVLVVNFTATDSTMADALKTIKRLIQAPEETRREPFYLGLPRYRRQRR